MTKTNISCEEALATILSTTARLDVETIHLSMALSRTLAVDIVAPRSLPPFANSGMDGFALRAADTVRAAADAPARLRVAHELPAGALADLPVLPGTAVRIMTGAPMPPSADTVVPLEEAQSDGDTVLISSSVRPGQHVRPVGEDILAGSVAVRSGQPLRPQEIGLLAALGVAKVSATRQPRVAIVASGNELISLGEPAAAGKIYDSDSPLLSALVIRDGGLPIPGGIAADTLESLHQRLVAAAEQADLILTAAGASGGDYDLVRLLLEREGRCDFWQVAMKPGRPLLAGVFAGVPVIGLPGNPAAALICAELFVRPALLAMAGRTDIQRRAVPATLAGPIARGPRVHYVRGAVQRAGNGFSAALSAGSHGAGSLTSLVQANALLVIPAGQGQQPAGSQVEAVLLD
jgi:molybdopterin molybdotransferase